MRKPNGYGSIIKLSGNRRKPYAVRVTTGWDIIDNNVKQKYRYLGYYASRKAAELALADYNRYSCTTDTQINLEQLWSMWEKDHVSKLAEKTITEYTRAWGTLASLYKEKLCDLDRKKLQNHFDTYGYAKNTARIVKIVLTQMFAYGARSDLISPDRANIPTFLNIDNLERKKVIKRANFEPQEISFMWKHEDDYKPYLILLYSGMRAGEFLALKKEDVFLTEQYFDIKKAKTAAGVRQVPIADKILPYVIEYYEAAEDYVFPFTYDYIHDFLKSRMDHNPHDTRHTFISMLTDKEVDERIIKQIVGHAGRGVTQKVYTHVSLKKKLEAVNLL